MSKYFFNISCFKGGCFMILITFGYYLVVLQFRAVVKMGLWVTVLR